MNSSRRYNVVTYVLLMWPMGLMCMFEFVCIFFRNESALPGDFGGKFINQGLPSL